MAKDLFISQKYCGRCGIVLIARTMSTFSEQPICPKCKQEEQQHPKYAAAREVERNEVLKGNVNYKGIGSPFEVSFTDKPSYGTVMPIAVFKKYCKEGTFTFDDGNGYYSFGEAQSNIPVNCDDFVHGKIDKKRKWTHVIWYNR